MKTKMTKLAAVAATTLLVLGTLMPLVQAQSTGVNQSTTGGALTITSPSIATSLTSRAALATTQLATGTITGIAPSDLRGTGAGWTVTMTSTNLGITGATVSKTRIAGTGTIVLTGVNVSGTYDGMVPQALFAYNGTKSAGQFTVRVDSVSLGLPATVTLTDPAGTATTPSVASNSISFNGLTVSFGTIGQTYAMGDIVGFNVDSYPYVGLTVTPANLASSGGSTSGVTLGSSGILTGTGATSGSHTDLVAVAAAGLGEFTYDQGLSQVLHGNPMVASYSSTLTFSIT